MAPCGQPVDNGGWRVNTVQQEFAQEALKGTPAVAGMAWTALTPDQFTAVIVGALTGVYVIAQLAYLIWKWRREARSTEATK